MDLQHVAPGPVQPGHDDEVVAGHEPVEALGCERTHFEPGVGRTLPALFRRFAARLEDRPDHTDRTQLSTSPPLHAVRASTPVSQNVW